MYESGRHCSPMRSLVETKAAPEVGEASGGEHRVA